MEGDEVAARFDELFGTISMRFSQELLKNNTMFSSQSPRNQAKPQKRLSKDLQAYKAKQ